MTTRIINLVKQLEQSEKEELLKHIDRQYSIKEKTNMLRDDIKDKVLETVEALYAMKVEETDSFRELGYDAVDITVISEILCKKFEIEEIQFSAVIEWEKVSDIINTIETQIECELHDEVER